MPFATWCPAGKNDTKAFGFKIIGLLVGTLCTEIGADWVIKGDKEPLLGLTKPLDSDRQANGGLELEHKRS